VALEALGRRSEAIESFTLSLRFDDSQYAAHRAIAFSFLADGRRDRALDHLARTYELRRGDDRNEIAATSLSTTSLAKLSHDAAQFRYLAGLGRGRTRFEMLARNYEAVRSTFPTDEGPLRASDLEILGENYNTLIHSIDAPEIPGGALAERSDRDQIAREFATAGQHVVYFDDLLTPQALHSLRRYLMESTIWHDFSHIRGFVATYLEDGLACPLLLQISDDIRRVFPELLAAQPLTQAWAFKGLDSKAAIGAHADDAAISINFWITPTAANVDPSRGGMGICVVPPPPDWKVQDYDRDRQKATSFVDQNRQHTRIVPYRENRAVLFESRLLHFSDAPEFAEGYENNRLNITLLFGRARRPGSR
jgi:hypothetical protein